MVTDGRFSGATRGLMAGHVAPEAASGGPIAAIHEGDTIVLRHPEPETRCRVERRRTQVAAGGMDGAGAALHERRHGQVRAPCQLGVGGRRHGMSRSAGRAGRTGRSVDAAGLQPCHGMEREQIYEKDRRTNHLGIAAAAGHSHCVRVSRRRDPSRLRRDARLPDPSHSRAARAGRDAHGRRVRARDGPGRRRDRDVRPRRDEHGDRHRHRDARLVADRLHHGPGRQQADRQRRVPGDGHHRRHAAGDEAQLPRDARGRRRADRSAKRSTWPPRGVPAPC